MKRVPATGVQVVRALRLLEDAGYSTRLLDWTFRELGATPQERRGSVRDWLGAMDQRRIGWVMERLVDEIMAQRRAAYRAPR